MPQLKTQNQNKAFTLAEVLITLGIIGIVAAMTIPTLINNTNQKELITKFKKSFSALNSATKQIVALNGGIDTSSAANVVTQYKSVMNSPKDALLNDGINFSPTKIYKYYKTTTNAGYDYSAAAQPAFVTSDGAAFSYGFIDANCNTSIAGVTESCGLWYIDVNGSRGPNMWGYDFFQGPLVYRNGEYRIIPFGAGNGDPQTCSPNSSNAGTSNGCTTSALLDTLP